MNTNSDDIVHDTMTTGSRLPADVPWTGVQSGIGLKPDIFMVAGESDTSLPPRPVRAKMNDAKFDHGIIAEGQMNGETNPEGVIPWL